MYPQTTCNSSAISRLAVWVHWRYIPATRSGVQLMRDENKDHSLKLRMSATEMDLFRRAAQAEGLTLSAWMRMHLLRVARRATYVLHEGGGRGKPLGETDE